MIKMHLSYCTNVHPQTNYANWQSEMAWFARYVGNKFHGSPAPLGLWLGSELLQEILQDDWKEKFTGFFQENDINVFTLNAFPYGNFHAPEVKKSVYLPDWTDPRRLEYTKNCAEVLSAVLRQDWGTISTVPLGWGQGWNAAKQSMSLDHLLECVLFLRKLAQKTGKPIRLCLEPEPGCVLEKTSQVILFWNEHLRPACKRHGIMPDELDEYLGLCYDTCHQAVQFEDAAKALASLRVNHIPIHKMQLSSAVQFSPDPEKKSLPTRKKWIEPRFLHQTRIRNRDVITKYDDLPNALSDPDANWNNLWRVHYHVPLQWNPPENQMETSTRDEMTKALSMAVKYFPHIHFEVETYTWTVLPKHLRPQSKEQLGDGLARELIEVDKIINSNEGGK